MEERSLTLNKESTPEQTKAYFRYVLESARSDNEFPVDLDEVWMLVYNKKSDSVLALKSNFIENIDYQVLRKNPQNPNGGRPTEKYYLTTSCLEYFIARKVRPVFDIYREVFHAAIRSSEDNAEVVPIDTDVVFRLDRDSTVEEISGFLRFCKKEQENGNRFPISVKEVFRLSFDAKRRVTDRLLGINHCRPVYVPDRDYEIRNFRGFHIKSSNPLGDYYMNLKTFYNIMSSGNYRIILAWREVFGRTSDRAGERLLFAGCDGIDESELAGSETLRGKLADAVFSILYLRSRADSDYQREVLDDTMEHLGKYRETLSRTS